MAFLENLGKFMQNNWMYFVLVILLGIAGVIAYAYLNGLWPFPPPMPTPKPSSYMVKQKSDSDDGRQAHLAPYTLDDFKYLDLSSAVVVPTTDPTNDVQSFTKHVDEYGQVTWEPNVMMDPIDILGQEDYDQAIDAVSPNVSQSQLKRLTTPRYLQEGSVFWGTPWPEGGPGACNVRGCPTKSDVVHKGIFSDNTDHGTYGAGPC